MRYFHLNKNKYHCPVVNLEKLWSLVGEEARVAAAKETSTAPVIDVTKHGYFKVRGARARCWGPTPGWRPPQLNRHTAQDASTARERSRRLKPFRLCTPAVALRCWARAICRSSRWWCAPSL